MVKNLLLAQMCDRNFEVGRQSRVGALEVTYYANIFPFYGNYFMEKQQTERTTLRLSFIDDHKIPITSF